MSITAVRPLNDALKAIAKESLNEVESNIQTEIATLKDWIKTQPHITARTEDQYLLAFLRSSKHMLEKSKLKIDYFYSIKCAFPEISVDIVMNEKFQEFARIGAFIWPPIPANSGDPFVCITRLDKINNTGFTLYDIYSYRFMAMEYFINEIDNLTVAAMVEIFDMENAPYRLYTQLDYIFIRKIQAFGEKGLPYRYKSLHVINCRKEFTHLLNWGKSLLIEKYKNRFFVHKNIEELQKHVPKSLLPVEYGGTNGTVEDIATENTRQMMSYADYFIENTKFRTNESLRLKNGGININSLFGAEGSFKKLEID